MPNVVTKAQHHVEARPLLYLNLRAFIWPGLAVILIAAPLLRGLFFRPERLMLEMLVAVVFALWIADRVITRSPALKWEAMDAAAVVFLLAYILSLAGAVSLPNATGSVLEILMYFLLYLMLSRLATGRLVTRTLAIIFWAGVAVAVVSLGATTGYLYFPGAFVGQAIYSTFQYKNTGAAYLLATGVIGLVLQGRRWQLPDLIFYGIGNYLGTVVILGSQSRGGWVLFPLVYLALLLALPRDCRNRCLYALMVNLGVALVIGRRFLPAVLAGQYAHAMYLLLAGALAIAIVHFIIYLAAGYLAERAEARVRQFLALGAIIYLVLALAAYAFYAAQAFPRAAQGFVPGQVAARADTISGYEPSFQSRLQFYRDALKIIKDHPLIGTGGGGWNALYHRYQPYQYFTTEVHNHFLQVGVEAGLLGLGAFLALFVTLFIRLHRLYRERDEEASDQANDPWPYIWSAGIAALALAAHSFFDFDLSLPAVALTLWACLALVRAMSLGVEVNDTWGKETPGKSPARSRWSGLAEQPATCNWPGYPGRIGLGVSPVSRPGRSGFPGQLRVWHLAAIPSRLESLLARPVVFALSGLILAVTLFFPANAFYRAGVTGADAAKAMQAGALDRAKALYEQALDLDPFQASYLADLAQVDTALGLSRNDAGLQAMARNLAAAAARREPFNPQIRATLAQVYFLQGYIPEAVAEAEAVIEANPWDVKAYEGLGQMYLGAAGYLERFGFKKEARPYLEKARDLPARVTVKAQKIVAGPYPWQGPPFTVTPALKFIQGQAAYLLGEGSEAVVALQVAWQDAGQRVKVAPWLAAALDKNGAPDQAARIIKDYPTTDDEYKKLRERMN